MHDVANSRADAHCNLYDEFFAMADKWQEAPAEGATSGAISGETAPDTKKEVQIGETCRGLLDILDFGNRLDYYLRTWDNRAWTMPGRVR